MNSHNITKGMLRDRLYEISKLILKYTQPIVLEKLPNNILYDIEANSSSDGNPLKDDEELFPKDSNVYSLHLAEATDWLWRNGKVPEWVDARVSKESKESTTVLLEACGRFTALEKHLYHIEEGYPPFHAQSPVLPPAWNNVKENGQFSLYWRKKLNEQS